MKHLTFSAGVLAAGLFTSGVAFAQTAWDMPTPYGDGNFHTKNIAEFAKEVDAKTNGSLKITIHSNQSLIKHPDIKSSVRDGVVPIGELLVSRLENESPIFGVDSVPFLASSYDLSKKLYDAQRPYMEKLLADQGLELLFSVPWPPQGIYTKKDINTIADLEGLKFRAYNLGTERVAALAKMVPTQIEASDVPTAFATGRVEAMITSPSTGTDAKVWDFLTNYYDTQAWLPRNMVIVNKAAFDKLSDAEKAAVKDAAVAAETRGWEASKVETATKTKMLSDNKVKVAEPSADLKAGFAEIGKTITDEWKTRAGADGEALLKTYSGQ